MPPSSLDMPRSPSLPRSTPAPLSTTSTVLNHTIPPFYACYLLRSFNKQRGGTYIGSTPDPPRRFKQHSGEIKGGAYKTQRGRPWEMEAIVYGFPSKLQALQFEWAWQNPHASRHLHAPLKGDGAGEKPVAQFPKTALSNRPLTKIQVLQYMLTVPPWRSFNLSVLLFSLDARSWWAEARRLGPVARTEAGVKKWKTERAKAGTVGQDPWEERGRVVDAVRVEVREEGVDGMRLVRAGQRAEEEAIERIRVDDHEFFDPHWEKWTSLADSMVPPCCIICAKPVDPDDHLSFFLCTSATSTAIPCTAVYHLPCLSRHFLSPVSTPASSTEASSLSTHLSTLPSGAPPSTRSAPLVPTHGTCPSCHGALHWVDLVRGSYRRKEEEEGTRKKRTFQKGSKDPQAKKRTRKGAASSQVQAGGKMARAKGKGKGKAAAADSGSEDDERFDFDSDGHADVGSDADSVDLDAEKEEEQERSWAQSVAAEGALVDFDADGMFVDEWGDDSPPAAAPASPSSKKKRGRPPKSTTAAVAKAASPPRVAEKAAPRRRASPVTKKATATLSSAFSSTKASLSTSTGAASTSKPSKPRAVHPPSDTDDDLLPPPSRVGVAAAKKVPRKKVEYVELSD